MLHRGAILWLTIVARLGRIRHGDVRASPVPLGDAPFSCVSEARMSEAEAKNELEDIRAEVINLRGGVVETVEADMVRISQGGANRIVAKAVELDQGGSVSLQGDSVSMLRSGAAVVRGDYVAMEGSTSGLLVAEESTLRSSRSGVIITERADLNNSSSVLLLAREVNGPIETVLDTEGALLAGLTAGIAVGLVLFVSRLLTRRR